MNEIKVNLLDFAQQKIFSALLSWHQDSKLKGIIKEITPIGNEDPALDYLLPGFIDAHVHIESSMMLPSEFGRMAVKHGTIASVSDPHEIANVMGIKGIEFMLANSEKTPFHFFFGAPSCVPATPFETAGASITADDINTLFASGKIKYLSEMMNFPGVLSRAEEVMSKLKLAQDYGFPIDGHAPGLVGDDVLNYAQAGISTDHECTTLDEAREKIAAGMKILIREGSAARDFADLHPLISEFPDSVMFCSDDKHPDELAGGHINQLVSQAVALGHSVFDVLTCACLNPIEHYQLPLGTVQKGQILDAVLVEDLGEFKIKTTWLAGEIAAQAGQSLLPSIVEVPINCFKAKKPDRNSLRIIVDIEKVDVEKADAEQVKTGQVRVIDVFEGKLFTREKLINIDQFQQSP
ncbi:MAG: amidohydrolase family protein, partial [Gammaproteobacteria bacterium]|nr:amidohydrolase family protein [Gammaproteobacteria bacterium]